MIDYDRLVDAIRRVARTVEAGYGDATDCAKYLGISKRQFDLEIAPHLPTIRINKRGKRIYRFSDVDRFMEQRIRYPQNVDALVDDVLNGLSTKD